MNAYTLNLGPFNRCVENVDSVEGRSYDVSGRSQIFFHCDGDNASSRPLSSFATIPKFTLGLSIKGDTLDKRHKLLRLTEFKILSIIYNMAYVLNVDFSLEDVCIPVELLDFEMNSKGRLCLTTVLGILIFGTEKKNECKRGETKIS